MTASELLQKCRVLAPGKGFPLDPDAKSTKNFPGALPLDPTNEKKSESACYMLPFSIVGKSIRTYQNRILRVAGLGS